MEKGNNLYYTIKCEYIIFYLSPKDLFASSNKPEQWPQRIFHAPWKKMVQVRNYIQFICMLLQK